jgi:hypothetical protein
MLAQGAQGLSCIFRRINKGGTERISINPSFSRISNSEDHTVYKIAYSDVDEEPEVLLM